MLSVAYNPNMCSFQPYNPYEQLLLEQELQRRRQIEALQLRRQLQLEELERRRQYEYGRQMAELRRRREMELMNECRYGRGVESLFDALRAAESPFARRRSTPSREPDTSGDVERRDDEENAVSKGETTIPASTTPVPTSTSESSTNSSEPQTDAEVDIETEALLAPNPSETSASHATISRILSALATLRSDFTFPTQLDFAPSATSSSPKLSFASSNAPVHQYEHQLTGLLTQLDAVESYGDGNVRKARKEAVKEVERELEELDGKKAETWRRVFGSEEAAEEVVEDSAPAEEVLDMEASQPEESTVVDEAQQETTGCDSAADPSYVPLPYDEEMDDPISDSSVAPTLSSPNVVPTTPHSPTLSSPAIPPVAETLVDATSSPPESVLSTLQLPTSSALPTQPLPDADKHHQSSSSESSGSETSESELDEFVEIDTDMDVETMSTTSVEEVERDRDLAEMNHWEVDF
ncbi:hypothetical protein BDV93DRAFT_528324 [Ceratobasidium sp. AG-I]|nr:hypothetical protein BDV93DRAFT_528324 [Ceratobasidium sp. AG-I]